MCAAPPLYIYVWEILYCVLAPLNLANNLVMLDMASLQILGCQTQEFEGLLAHVGVHAGQTSQHGLFWWARFVRKEKNDDFQGLFKV